MRDHDVLLSRSCSLATPPRRNGGGGGASPNRSVSGRETRKSRRHSPGARSPAASFDFEGALPAPDPSPPLRPVLIGPTCPTPSHSGSADPLQSTFLR